MTIIVCGAGTMGIGIAENAARSGYPTVLYDLAPGVLEKASSAIEKNLSLLAEKNKITAEEKNKTLERLRATSDINTCSGDIVIEAIIEKNDAKIELFRQLAGINDPRAIFASNTSSLSISTLASQIPHPERVCGMHFFNPAQVMKLVEVVEGSLTAPWVTEKISALATSLGKVPVTCKDSPGFIVNRVARHFYLESLQLLEDGIGRVESIDNILEATGFKMGPFRLMDLIGNDINYAVTESLYEACGKPVRFRPSAIQRAKVNNKELGRKSGKGYYTY
jgi:3-hydroxybutyryl-CoA dehydrogenase